MTTKNNANNVTYGKPNKVGAVFYAPVGTALPTTATEELNAAFVCVGYISEDGVTNSDTISSDHVSSWGGDAVLYTQGEHEDTFQHKMIEATNANTLIAVYGSDNVTVADDGSITVRSNSDEKPTYSWVYDLLLKNGGVKRIVVPEAKLTDMSEIQYTDSDPVGYDCTYSAMPSEQYDGDTHREFIVPGTTSSKNTTSTTTSEASA